MSLKKKFGIPVKPMIVRLFVDNDFMLYELRYWIYCSKENRIMYDQDSASKIVFGILLLQLLRKRDFVRFEIIC